MRVPGSFGQVSAEIPPRIGVSAENPHYQGALLQHRCVNLAREHIALRYRGDIQRFVEEEFSKGGVTVDRMRRIMRGETQMLLADLLMLISRIPGATEHAVKWLGYDLDDQKDQLRFAKLEADKLNAKVRQLEDPRRR